MPAFAPAQTELRIGIDVGGTFTDLVAWDGSTLRILKIPSTPPDFQSAVVEATRLALGTSTNAKLIHGSTVATNALLQRSGEPVAFITTEGFADMLTIGRQNRPRLYDLHVRRRPPVVPRENCFTLNERIDAQGGIVKPLLDSDLDAVIDAIVAKRIEHVAVCLLFSFANPAHEQQVGRRCEARGLKVSLSSDILPEFREFERASTTAINASLRSTVQTYLDELHKGLPPAVRELRIMHSAGGTLRVDDAARRASRMVLSGPAGGVIGAAFVSQRAGYNDVITYDMGGTSTDVALILNGKPRWTTATSLDGLPIAVPMFDIQTVGAGGGSIAYVDAGGALRVGPNSAGARPGPACYGRGGTLPTVTDANLLLGRIIPDQFLNAKMPLSIEHAKNAVSSIATRIEKDLIATSLGIVRIAEAHMTQAIRAVTSRRGHDPRGFALVSFGGAGGLHACALAESLGIDRVLVPPHCGVLSALGMVLAPPLADASRTLLQLGEALDDDRIASELAALASATVGEVPDAATAMIESFADVRYRGQAHELTVPITSPSRSAIHDAFQAAYLRQYGRSPANRAIEIVSLRLRRIGRAPNAELPPVERSDCALDTIGQVVLADGRSHSTRVVSRSALIDGAAHSGPLLIVDPDATTLIPQNWSVRAPVSGTIEAVRHGAEEAPV